MSKFVFSCAAALCMAVLTFTGCGSPSDQPELGTVTGRITYDGKPVPNYIVNFQPPTGRPSVGSTDQNGNYTLDYTLTTKGAKVGTHKVFLIYSNEADVNQGEGSPDGEDLPPDARKLMKTYGSVETTPLTADVKGGPNVLNFELNATATPEKK